jgi:hypothetical protein
VNSWRPAVGGHVSETSRPEAAAAAAAAGEQLLRVQGGDGCSQRRWAQLSEQHQYSSRFVRTLVLQLQLGHVVQLLSTCCFSRLVNGAAAQQGIVPGDSRRRFCGVCSPQHNG